MEGILLEKWFRAGLVLLVISLVLNIYTASKLSGLTNKVNALWVSRIDKTALETVIRQGITDLQSLLRQIREEQRWVTPVKVEPGKRSKDKQKIKLSWQIKDYPQGAPVTFYYREPGAAKFKSLPATPVGGGHFQVELEMKCKLAPDWGISQVYKENAVERSRESTVESVSKSNCSSYVYDYYIALKDGNRIRSSEVETIDLGKVPMMLVAPLQVKLEIDKYKDQFKVTLLERSTKEPEIKVDRVLLEVYHNNKKLAEEEVPVARKEKHGNWEIPIYELVWNPKGQPFDYLYLRVEYENGETVRQEIFSK